MVNTTYITTEDLNKQPQSVKSKTKSKFYEKQVTIITK